MEIRAQIKPWYDGISIAVYKIKPDCYEALDNLVWKEIKEGEAIPEAFSLNMEEAQVLLNDLWHCGIRPTDGTGSTGQLSATQKHLDDMRKISFFLLEKGEK